MKSQLPALIMLLSDFWKPMRAAHSISGRGISARSFSIGPTPAVGETSVSDSAAATSVFGSATPHEANGFTPSISRGGPWSRSKKKRFG